MKLLEQNVLKTKVMDWNAGYYGVSIYSWMDRAGKGIAKIIGSTSPALRAPSPGLGRERGKGQKLKIAFFCGTGNNGGDGFAAAKYLYPQHDVKVYLFGKEQDIRTEEARRMWRELKGLKVPNVILEGRSPDRISRGFYRSLRGLQNDKCDIVVDCLVGTGAKGKLREPIASAVKLFNTLRQSPGTKSVTVDVPTPGIKKIDLAISMQFAKVEGAEVVDLKPDAKFMSKIGPGEVKALKLAKPGSHKGQNGRLLIIAGSEQYHGSLLYTVKTASRIVDLIYVMTTEENQELIKKLKSKTAEFISLRSTNPYETTKKVDCILIGPGMGRGKRTVELTRQVLKSKKKAVLDADALTKDIIPWLSKQVILTPHKGEYQRMFGKTKIESVVRGYGCTVALKGKVDVVASPDWGIKYNYTGNEGLTKGGTGDVLAGLIATFYCKNDAYLSAAAGVFVNGLAGDELYKKVKTFYDAEDLLERIPKTLARVV